MVFTKGYINCTKLVSEIRKNNFQVGNHKRTIFVGSEKREKDKPESERMKVAFSINMESGEPVEFTYFDFVVCDTLYSLYHNKEERAQKNITVSIGEVLRMMSGDFGQTLTAAKKQVIRASIEKLAKTEICIDFSEEAKCRRLPQSVETFVDGKIAPLVPVEGKPDKYRFIGEMPLYYYAQSNNQIISYPISLLGTHITDTNETIMIKHYLIKRLELIRNPANSYLSTLISYFHRVNNPYEAGKWGGLLGEIGITVENYSSPSAWNKKVRSVNQNVIYVLDSFKEKGYIFGYSIKEENGVPTTIVLHRKKSGGAGEYAANPWTLSGK